MCLKNKVTNILICLLFFTFLCQSCSSDPVIKPENGSVVILGSSNAFGVGASLPSNSWAQLLKKEISEPMYNLSYPGYTTYQFLPYNVPNYRNIIPDKERNIEVA